MYSFFLIKNRKGNSMKKEEIGFSDWEALKEKYKENIDFALEKLKENYPIQYLIGNVEFLNTVINVDERVLIPRYETELLVEKTIQKIKKLDMKNPKILELGCGSGCISIALKKNIACEITSIDISEDSIELAKENAIQNNVVINFKLNDMLKENLEQYDIIISNPPYVAEEENVGLETKYEPQNAIFAANNGLYFYEEILKRIKETKSKPKLIAFEIGYQQKYPLEEFQKKYLSTYSIYIEKDLTLKDRYAFLIKNE